MFRRPFVYLGQSVGVNVFALVGTILGLPDRLDLYPGTMSEPFNGLSECKVLSHLQEGKDSTTGAACKALKNLLGRINEHAWLMVLVKWTQTNHLLSLSGQIHVLGDDIYNVVGLLNAVYDRPVKHQNTLKSNVPGTFDTC